MTLLASCDLFLLGQQDVVPPPQACRGDADCDAFRSEVCRLPDGSGSPAAESSSKNEGICIVPGTPTERDVWLEIRPDRSTHLPQTQFGPVGLGSGQNQEIVLPAPALVSGQVVYSGYTPTQAVGGARVRFRMTPLIPGRPLIFDFESDTQPETRGSLGKRAIPAGTYSIVVNPPDIGDARAPAEPPIEISFPEDSTQHTEQLVFIVSNANELIQVSGSLVFERAGQEVPAADVEVWAVEASVSERGAAAPTLVSSSRSLSQPVRTDERGGFTLLLPRLPPDAEHVFRLQVSGTTGGAPFPTTVSDEVFTVDASAGLDSRAHLPAVMLGTIEEPSPVLVTVVDEWGSPLSGARITMRPVGATYSFTATGTSDDSGQSELYVFPGTWTAVAQPPPGVPLGLCVPSPEEHPSSLIQMDVEDSGKGSVVLREIVLHCPPTQRLAGHVLDHRLVDGEAVHRFVPVPNVSVEAVRRPDSVFSDVIHVQGRTRTDGTFDIHVTPGVYDVAFFPTSSSKLPFKHVQTVEVLADDELSPLVVVLDEPFELFGQLFSGNDSTPVGGTIEAYAIDPEGNALLVGRGIAQLDGSYSILLPGLAR